MIESFNKINRIKGELRLPGDKSISHRAVMFGSLAAGTSYVSNLSSSEDVASSRRCFEQLGVMFEDLPDGLKIKGCGFKGFKAPVAELYAGNSGTTARIMAGILCAQDFESIMTGDESLTARPMRRVVNPLRLMNAEIETSEVGTLPIKIKPSRGLIPIDYKLEVASAQVKSALLLAALHLEEESRIIEPIATRNHTELMLGLSTKKAESGTEIFASRKNYPEPFQLFVPSDISSAAFFIVLALITKNSELLIKNVSLNESRTGIITVLKKMGAEIIIDEHASGGREKMGDLLVRSSRLANVEIPAGLIPNIIDEIPVLAVAGLFAEGEFKVANAKELRVKECDRIKAVCYNMKAAGAEVEEFEDGFVIKGLHSHSEVQFESFGDHRIAMAFAVLSMALESGGRVNQFDAVSISNPGFVGQVKSLTV